jgi:hypothetical protein
MLGNNLEKHSRAALWPASSLFPVAEGGNTDAHEGRETRLGEAVLMPNRQDIGCIELAGSSELCAAGQDFGAFLDTREERVKCVGLHGYSLSTMRRSFSRCEAVRTMTTTT